MDLYKHVSDKSMNCLSVGNFGILSVVICVLAHAYTNLCRVYFRDHFSDQVDNTALCLKKYHKNERHLRLVAYTFTKHSHNVCLINTRILMY